MGKTGSRSNEICSGSLNRHLDGGKGATLVLNTNEGMANRAVGSEIVTAYTVRVLLLGNMQRLL